MLGLQLPSVLSACLVVQSETGCLSAADWLHRGSLSVVSGIDWTAYLQSHSLSVSLLLEFTSIEFISLLKWLTSVDSYLYKSLWMRVIVNDPNPFLSLCYILRVFQPMLPGLHSCSSNNSLFKLTCFVSNILINGYCARAPSWSWTVFLRASTEAEPAYN